MRRAWTTGQLDEAARHWAAGLTRAQIADAMGRSQQAIHHMILRHRERFPHRKENGQGQVKIALTVSPMLAKYLTQAAREANISRNMLIRRVLRDVVVRGKVL